MGGGRNRKTTGASEDGRRRYPHSRQTRDPVKIAHNAWVCAAALEHGGDVMVLDGLDLNTTARLVASGVPPERIHVPNGPDFDALMKRERATFGGGAAGAAPAVASGHVYRATAQRWVEAYASLAPPRSPVRTVWLDLNARWGASVEKTLRALFESRALGRGRGDLFLTLSRGYYAKQIDEVGGLVAALFRDSCVDGRLSPVHEHSANYGTGMMILHWRVEVPVTYYERFFGAADAVPLADRMARETRAFRKPQNVRRAAAAAVDVIAVGGAGDGDAGADAPRGEWYDSALACACADMAGYDDGGSPTYPARDVPLTTDDGEPVDEPAAPVEDEQTRDGGGFAGPMKGFAFRAVV